MKQPTALHVVKLLAGSGLDGPLSGRWVIDVDRRVPTTANQVGLVAGRYKDKTSLVTFVETTTRLHLQPVGSADRCRTGTGHRRIRWCFDLEESRAELRLEKAEGPEDGAALGSILGDAEGWWDVFGSQLGIAAGKGDGFNDGSDDGASLGSNNSQLGSTDAVGTAEGFSAGAALGRNDGEIEGFGDGAPLGSTVAVGAANGEWLGGCSGEALPKTSMAAMMGLNFTLSSSTFSV